MTKENSNKDKYYCSDCDYEINENDKICPNCGANVEEIEEDTSVPVYFKTLVWYAATMTLFGWLVLIAGIVSIIISFSQEVIFNKYAFLLGGISLIMYGIITIVNGELITCFVSIEKNTRETNNILNIKLNTLIKKIPHNAIYKNMVDNFKNSLNTIVNNIASNKIGFSM